MTGRPTPTALKLLKGNPGRRPLPENEPEPPGEVRKPAFVTYKATRFWKEFAPKLEAMGVLKSTDVVMFGAWCCLSAEFEESPRGFNAAKLAQWRALAASFGLEPSSRSRFSIPKAKKQDGTEEFFS